MGLARLIIFGLFFYLLYFIVKYIFIRFFGEGYAEGSNAKPHNPFDKKEQNNVIITYNPEKGRKNDKSVGKYVDYKEIKD